MDSSQQKNTTGNDGGSKVKSQIGKPSFKNFTLMENIPEYKGYRLMPAFNPHIMEYVNNEWEMPENSVFISSFQKTGTLWTSEIVRQILYSRDEKLLAMSKSIPMQFLALEVGISEKFDKIAQLSIPRKTFVTHVPEELFNFEKMKQRKGKMIYLLRNPKDQAVSLFHFTHKLPLSEKLKKELGLEWSEFFSNYVKGKIPMYMKDDEWYPDHILAWMKRQNDENFLVVVYEDMKKDSQKEIRRIANFLEVDVGDDDVAKIADVCSIKSMQKASGEMSGFHKINVRKGEVGGWKTMFTVAQSELMDKLMEEKLKGSGINFTYVL